VDNRRLLIAVVLSGGVLLLWQILFPPPRPKPQPPAPAAAPAVAGAPSPAPATGAAPSAAAPATTPGAAAPAPTQAAPATPPSEPLDVPTEPAAASAEQRLVVENESVRVEFTNRGAQIVSLVARNRTAAGGDPLELVRPRPEGPYPFGLVDATGAPLALDDALFEVERHDPTAAADGTELVFRYRGDAGAARKVFRVHDDGRIDFSVEVSGTPGFGVVAGPGLLAQTAAELGSRFAHRAAVWSSGGEVSQTDARGTKEVVPLLGATLDWVGLEDTYFLSVFVPEKGLAGARVEPLLLIPGKDPKTFGSVPLPTDRDLTAEEKKLPHDVRVVLTAADGLLAGSSYWGPKQYDRLTALGWPGIEHTMNWGWRGFLALPLLRGLQWIHAHVVSNYGWSIVLLTSVIKLLLLPLSIAAFKSMRKMQRLNPRMQAVREKWRGKLRDKKGRFNPDAQRQMNEEIMALYRTEGVNPAGGCLPTLVQLPIFYAFYTLLATAVELWHAPWLGWIHDLSAPDPYYILPIVMGVSQIVQQKMTPSPPDAVQRRLMQALPVVFTVFSLGFASGLVLYWLTNNLWSIGQQMLYNSFKDHHPEAGEAAVATGKGGKRS
jgi:YidC/Oxa1 family membrane protein insertase